MCMNDSHNTSKEAQPVVGIVLGSISLITVVMNILVLYAVKIEKKLQTVSNLYIISLSCADLIVGAAVMPLNIMYLLKNGWILPKEACKFWLSMDYVASTASIFSLFILCIDRFRSVQHPLKYLKYRTKTRASVMIVLAWLLSLLWVIPIFGWSYFSQNGINHPIHICETDFCKSRLFKVLTAMINFYVPSLFMLVFYTKIYKAVRRRYQSQDRINGSFRATSEKAGAHSGKLRGMKIVSQRASKNVRHLLGENQKFDHKKRTEPKHPDGTFAEIPKCFNTGGNCFVLKLSCFPQASAQSSIGATSADGNSATDDVEIQNKENTCPQNQEEIKTLNECHLAGQPACKNSPDLMLEQNEDSFPQDATRKDSMGLTYLKKTWKKLHSNSINYSQGLRMNRDRKAAKQLGIIMAVFMLCWTPYFISYMIVAFCDACYNHTVHMFTIWLGYVNSTLNPFIYPLCNENFKKAFKKILHSKT